MLDPESTGSCPYNGAEHLLTSLAFLNQGRLWQWDHSEEMDTSQW